MTKQVIVLKDIVKIFRMGDQELHALDDVNFTVEEGDFVAIMGPSGSGKSTMMNILGCLDRPTSGEYYLDGREVASLSDDELARTRNKKIGFVFQNFNLLSKLTAQENVALPLVYAGVGEEERMERARKALEDVGLGERLEHKPMEMSGGQRQRVAIARPSSTTRLSSWLTNRPGTWTPSPVTKSWIFSRPSMQRAAHWSWLPMNRISGARRSAYWSCATGA
jgi:ABC-type lipoprotein export system ATPase subunit